MRDHLMREPKLLRIIQPALFQEESSQTRVQPFIENLVEQPHHIGKARGHQFVRIIRHRGGLQHQRLIRLCGDVQHLALPFGGNRDIKLDAVHHAGGGKQAHIALQQAVKRDLPTFVGDDIGAQLALQHKK